MKRQNREKLQRALGIIEGVAGDAVSPALDPPIALIQAVLDDEAPGGGIDAPVRLRVKRQVEMPHIKSAALCSTCVFYHTYCGKSCRKCPQKLPRFKGACKCLKIKDGQKCPYYSKNKTNENKEKSL